MSKKILTQELEGTRRRERPRKRWKEEVERDLQVLRVRRWKQLVADRKKWTDLARQAKAHSVLQCQWKKMKIIPLYTLSLRIGIFPTRFPTNTPYSFLFSSTNLCEDCTPKTLLNTCYIIHEPGTAVAQWLRCCATNRKVTGSIPDGVIGIFH